MKALAAAAFALLGVIAWQQWRIEKALEKLQPPPAPPAVSAAHASDCSELDARAADALARRLAPLIPAMQPRTATAATSEAAPPAEAAAPTAREPEATHPPSVETQTLLTSVIKSGRMRKEDFEALHARLNGPDAAAREYVWKQIAVAINHDQLVPDDPHHLYP